MMIQTFLTGSILISGLLFLNRNRLVNQVLLAVFLAGLCAFTVDASGNAGTEEFYGLFQPDALSILFLIMLCILALPAFYHSSVYIGKEPDNPRRRGIYFASMTLLVAAMSAAYLSNHIAVTWIFVELTTLSASALIYHRRNSFSLEATWKYVFVSSISVTFIFIGILFLSIALQQAGQTDLTFPALLRNAADLNVFWLRLAFIFIFTGFTVKLGLAPMFTAGIDAKDKAPAPAGALFSSALVNVGFIGIFRFYEVIAHTSLHSWANNIILIAAVMSVFVSAVYMLKVTNIKRMFAYSSIEHMGLAMLGLAAGGIGYYAAILHVVLHGFVKSALFFQEHQVFRTYNSKNIFDMGGYFRFNTTGAMVLLLAFISATAMPPSGLFVSEFMIFRGLFESHHLFILIVVLILLTMIIWAFGKNIFRMMFTPPENLDETGMEKIKPYESISQFILLGLAIFLGLNPPVQFVELINEAIKNLPQ